MTEAAIEAMIDEALRRFELRGARVIHRVGLLEAREQIVLVLVTSAHRGDAFQGCEFLMDYLKTQAPFWKKNTRPAAPTGSMPVGRRRRAGALGHRGDERGGPGMNALAVALGAALSPGALAGRRVAEQPAPAPAAGHPGRQCGGGLLIGMALVLLAQARPAAVAASRHHRLPGRAHLQRLLGRRWRWPPGMGPQRTTRFTCWALGCGGAGWWLAQRLLGDLSSPRASNQQRPVPRQLEIFRLAPT